MADKKISELTAITGADTAADDYFIVVDTSGSSTKKISRAELNNAIEQDVLAQVDITSANIDGGTIDNTPIGASTPSTGAFTTLSTTGTTTLGGNLDLNGNDITFGDNDKATFGSAVGGDLQIYHDPNNGSYIEDVGSGNLIIKGQSVVIDDSVGNRMATFIDGGAVRLNYAGSQKLATTSTGADITGVLTADGLTVDAGGNITQGATGSNAGRFLIDNTTDTVQRLKVSRGGTSGQLAFHTGADSEAMRITAGGNVLMGTATSRGTRATIEGSSALVTAQGVLDVNSTDALGTDLGATISLGGVSTGAGAKSRYAVIGGRKENATDGNYAGYFQIATTNGSGTTSEAMRIDSSGNVLVGKTSQGLANIGFEASSAGNVQITRSAATPLVLNRLSSDGQIASFRKDGSEVGSIGAVSSDLFVGTGDTGVRFLDGSNAYIPYNPSTNSTRDNAIDLGIAAGRFKDLYLSGGVYLGGTANPNYFDDYEEGTWTPSFNLVTVTHTVQYGRYIKIGKMVHCKARIEVSSIDNTDASGIQMTVPISANSAVANGGTGCTFAYDSQNSTLMDGSHADVHGAYVSGTTFAVTNDTGGNMTYNQLTQTSGAFVFAFSYEAA